MATALVLEVHALDVQLSQWCASCALPSGYLVRMGVVDAESLRIISRPSVFACTECGAEVHALSA